MKNFYECTYIINPGLDDAQIENTIKATDDMIVKNSGQVVGIDHIGRRRLAYPIEKKHNGYYVSIEFEAEGKIVEKVERFLTLDENVMRYLTLKLDKRELEAKRNRTAFTMMATPVAAPPEEPKPETARKDAEKTPAVA